MASLQIEKGSFPRYGNRRITDIEYVERGDTTQDVNYTYSEVDTSITPDTYYYPNTSAPVCFPSDPIAIPVYLASITSAYYCDDVVWTPTMQSLTYNQGTDYEFSIDVISQDNATAGGYACGVAYPPALAAKHKTDLDYHDRAANSGVRTAAHFNTQRYPEEETIVTNERGTLHTFWDCWQLETFDPGDGHRYYRLVADQITGDPEFERKEGVANPISLPPIVPSFARTHTAYNCEVSVIKTQI